MFRWQGWVGGKANFKRQSAHPSEADRANRDFPAGKMRAKEGRIKSKLTKTSRQIIGLFTSPFPRSGPGGKAAAWGCWEQLRDTQSTQLTACSSGGSNVVGTSLTHGSEGKGILQEGGSYVRDKDIKES